MDQTQDALESTNAQQLWSAVIGSLEVQIANQADFDAFLADSKAIRVDGDTLIVAVRNGFVAEWIRQRVMKSLRRAVNQAFGRNLSVDLVTEADYGSDGLAEEGLLGDHTTWSAASQRRQRATLAKANAREFPLNRGMTFDRFCESPSNAVALNAALATATNEKPCYNPLTILSETGQGKTHLLHAIARQMQDSGMNVVCITAERFLNSFVQASRSGNVSPMRDRFLALDAFIVDGIEKLIGKKETQSFFLDIIDHLISNERQVVVAGNSSHPLLQLSDEIVSRLSGGLEVVIESPDKELRRALLKRHASDRGVELASDALDFLANRTVRNARELIGGIARVAAHVSLIPPKTVSAGIVTRAVAVEATRNRLTAPSPTLSHPNEIISAVAVVYDIPADTIKNSSRGGRNTSSARDLAAYLLREKCGLTSSQTGELLGGRSHSKIIAALQRYTQRRSEDINLMRMEQEACRALSQHTASGNRLT